MPTVRKIEESTRDGKDGFIVEWEMIGFTEPDARFRGRMATAMRFPTTVTETELVGVREFGKNDYNVRFFVPTEGFAQAGIKDPISWFKDEFGGDRVFTKDSGPVRDSIEEFSDWLDERL